jgi:DNA polymerase III epsilon subunit-like protein
MIIVDIECSGVDPQEHSILSIGAIDFADPQFEFYGECRIGKGDRIMKDALRVNGFTIKQCKDPSKQTPAELLEKFIYWASQAKGKTLGGHNVHFDLGFLKQTAKDAHIQFPFPDRIVDLHSICYAHLIKRGIEIPKRNGKSQINSTFVQKYVGLPKEPKPHLALTGAKIEAETFSRLFFKKNMFKEYAQYKIPEYL